MPNQEIGSVDKVKITTLVVDDAGYDTTFMAQFGLSMLVEVTTAGRTKRILVDTGLSSGPILYNLNILGIDLKSIDFIFLTHCHYDHTGGLAGILKEVGKEIDVVAHPSLFRIVCTLKPFVKYIGMTGENSREKIIQNGGRLLLIAEPFELITGVFSTGEVERVTDFEPREDTHIVEGGQILPDPEADDMSLAVNVKGAGLVILAGCSHAGIVNIIKQSKKITGVETVKAVIGGIHLRKASEEQLRKTVSALERVESVCAGHCTGFRALKTISDKLGDRLDSLHCGKTLEFQT